MEGDLFQWRVIFCCGNMLNIEEVDFYIWGDELESLGYFSSTRVKFIPFWKIFGYMNRIVIFGGDLLTFGHTNTFVGAIYSHLGDFPLLPTQNGTNKNL